MAWTLQKIFILLWLINQNTPKFSRIPDREYLIYETYDKGKIGEIEVQLKKDSLGYHITYKSDRFIEVILDTTNFQTLYLNKFVEEKWDLSAQRKGELFEVNYKGRKNYYKEKDLVFDRHTLDFALRGFEYNETFKKRIRLNLPEFMIINADLEVIGIEVVSAPIGDIECWLIKMTPRIIFIKREFYFWIEKEYPHRFIKYQDSAKKNQIILKSYKQ